MVAWGFSQIYGVDYLDTYSPVAKLMSFWTILVLAARFDWEVKCFDCWELTTLWVARLDDSAELKVTDPKEQQGDVEEEEAEGKERWDRIDWGRRWASC